MANQGARGKNGAIRRRFQLQETRGFHVIQLFTCDAAAEADLRGIEPLAIVVVQQVADRLQLTQQAIEVATVMPRTGVTRSPSRHRKPEAPNEKSPLTASAPECRPSSLTSSRYSHRFVPRPRRGGRARTPGDEGPRPGHCGHCGRLHRCSSRRSGGRWRCCAAGS